MVPSLPLLSCEFSVSVKENPDRKKKKKKCAEQFVSMIYVFKETTFKTSTLIVKPNKWYTAPF